MLVCMYVNYIESKDLCLGEVNGGMIEDLLF